MIDNKFLFYKTLDSFKIDLQDGLISRESIAFIKQPTVIWTHNTYYNCTGYPGDEYLSWYNDGHADKDTRKNSNICWKYNGNEVNTVSIDITNDDFVMTLDNPYNLTPVEITITGTEGVVNIENNTVRLIQDQSLRVSGTVTIVAKFDGNDEYKPSTVPCNVVVNKAQYTAFGWNKISDEIVIGQELGHIFPVLNNDLNFENITYSSSNRNVATIEEDEYDIHIVGTGTTTITASFAGNNLYEFKNVTYTLTVKDNIIPIYAYIGAGTDAQSVILNSSNKIDDYTGQKTYNIQVLSGDNIWIVVPSGITYSAYMGGQPMGLEDHSEGITISNVQYDVKSTIPFNTASTKTFTLTYNQ